MFSDVLGKGKLDPAKVKQLVNKYYSTDYHAAVYIATVVGMLKDELLLPVPTSTSTTRTTSQSASKHKGE